MDDVLAVLDALISSFDATVTYESSQSDQLTQQQAQITDLTDKLSADDKAIASFKDKVSRLQSLAAQLKQSPPSPTPLPGQNNIAAATPADPSAATPADPSVPGT